MARRRPPGREAKESIEELEKEMILKALEEADNHQTKAAGILGSARGC
ncbi:MAG: hypothetical protein IPI61_10125 [Syntrophaceae bacterium]|nr:hypothetical protein [Syntrophaceae bacterium]